MRTSTVAKRLAEFRIRYSPIDDVYKTQKELAKYYRAMIDAQQVEVVVKEPDERGNAELIATCEVWFVKAEDVELIKSQKVPRTVSKGKIAYIANVTLSPGVEPKLVFLYFRKLLKMKYPLCNYVFWRHDRNGRVRYTKLFRVIRDACTNSSRNNSGSSGRS